MPLNKAINGYFDVEQILTAARAQGGAIYRMASPGAARHWRQRAYYYRKLLTINDAKAHYDLLGYVPATPWDDMLLSQLTGDDTCIRITFGELRGSLEALERVAHRGPKNVAETHKGEPVDWPADNELTTLALQLSEEIEKK